MLTIAVAILAVSLLALIAVMAGGRLPPRHAAAVRARYAASPDTVWALVADRLGAASWRRDIDLVEPIAASDNVLRWRERSRRRVIEFEALPPVPGRRFTTRIAQDDLPFAGQWDFDLSPDGSGTALVITEQGEIRPPLFRLLTRHVFGYTHSLEAYHRSLAARLGEKCRLEIVSNGR